MNRFLIILLAIALAGALIFSGCPQPAPTTTPTQTTAPTTTAAPTQQPKELKIGATLNLTDVALGELPQARWYQLYAKLINDQGGWKLGGDTYKINMIIYDDQGDPIKEKNNLEKLVLQDGVKFILNGSSTPGVDIEITEPNKVIILENDLSDVISDPAVQYAYQGNGMYFARGLGYVLAVHFAQKGVKTYVSLKTDTELGHYATMLGDLCWQTQGVKMVGEVYFALDTSDFGPIATKVMSYKPDLVDMNYCSNIVQCYSALHDAGYKGALLPSFADQALVDNLVTQCGKEFIEGGECFYQDPRGYQTDPEMLAYMDAYVEEYGNFGTEGILFSGTWFLLKDAIENTQSVDVEVIKAYLDNSDHAVMTLTTYTQLMARPDLGNYRTICGNPVDLVGRIHDGKLETFASVGPKTHYLSAILAYGQVDIYKEYWEEYGYPTFPDEPSAINFSDLGITGHD